MTRLKINSRSSRLSFTGVAITSFEVRAILVKDLWRPVGTVPTFIAELKASIEAKGLANPIIVVRLPREDLIESFRIDSRAVPNYELPSIPDDPVINTVWGGSNRLEAIKQLGYTHVDCVMIPDFQTAMQIQDRQRSSYKKNKGETNVLVSQAGI